MEELIHPNKKKLYLDFAETTKFSFTQKQKHILAKFYVKKMLQFSILFKNTF